MLPSSVLPDTPFIMDRSAYVRHYRDLEHRLKVPPMTYPAFRDTLNLPQDLQSEQDITRYRRLLQMLISHHHEDSRDVFVPCSTGVMVKASTLYGRSEIFLRAFATRLMSIIHPSFWDLEDGLAQFGLRDRVNFSSFEGCARAIHEDIHGPDRVARSADLFQCYCETLPLLPIHGWHQLDLLRFIPRDHERRRSSELSESSMYCRILPEIVAPSEILRPDLEGIAWTQRASSLIPSGQRLLVAHLGYGVPSVDEVVSHLFNSTRLLPESDICRLRLSISRSLLLEWRSIIRIVVTFWPI
jgi:hypothetical protein